MSEQNQSNFQAIGAGLLGFAVVMALGGGALMVHHSSASKAAKPAAAAAPIDIGAPVPRFESAPVRPQMERRAESPAPLIGVDEAEAAESAPAQSAASPAAAPSSSAEAAPAERARLKTTAHAETGGRRAAEEAVVRNTIVEEKEEAVAKAKAPVKKLPAKLPQAAGAEVASVHYGVTNRSELMGRAAGPVYNIKGGGAVGSAAPQGKMAEDLNSKVADLKKQLDGSGLPPEARDKLLKDLAEAQKALPKTASAQ